MSNKETTGMVQRDATVDVSSLPPSEPIDPTIRINKWAPGTAIGYKGEPSAKELALLQFHMTPAEKLAASGIMKRILDREEALDRLGEEAVENRIQRIVKTISEQGRAAEIVEVFEDPIELGNPHFRNGNGGIVPEVVAKPVDEVNSANT